MGVSSLQHQRANRSKAIPSHKQNRRVRSRLLDLASAIPSAGKDAGRKNGAGRAMARIDRKSTRLNSSHPLKSRMPSSA